ncbi:MAG: cvpA [Gammaproteobacteria bacterium]|jgi:membrane protein required for colicin V production|nr:cvpA [Gammaproteobacteria bacterium]
MVMTSLDYAIFFIVIVTIAMGAWRGWRREMLALITWGSAFLVACYLTPWVSTQMNMIISEPTLRSSVVFAVLFLSVLLTGVLIDFLTNLTLARANTSAASRSVGGLLGFTRGMVIVSALLVFGQMSHLNTGAAWQGSKVAPYFKVICIKSNA